MTVSPLLEAYKHGNHYTAVNQYPCALRVHESGSDPCISLDNPQTRLPRLCAVVLSIPHTPVAQIPTVLKTCPQRWPSQASWSVGGGHL